jgi:hypothetical protein
LQKRKEIFFFITHDPLKVLAVTLDSSLFLFPFLPFFTLLRYAHVFHDPIGIKDKTAAYKWSTRAKECKGRPTCPASGSLAQVYSVFENRIEPKIGYSGIVLGNGVVVWG